MAIDAGVGSASGASAAAGVGALAIVGSCVILRYRRRQKYMDCARGEEYATYVLDPDAQLPFGIQWYEFLRGSDKYWSRRTFVKPGDTYTPSREALNGHRYVATLGGSTGIREPLWPTGSDETVADGGVTWKEAGSEDTILTSAWNAGGLTSSAPIVDSSGCVTSITLAGQAGSRYTITNSIVSVMGKKQDQSFTVIVKNR